MRIKLKTESLKAWIDRHSDSEKGSKKVAEKSKLKWNSNPSEFGFYYVRHRKTGRILKTQVCWADGNLWAHPEWPGGMSKKASALKEYECAGPMPCFG